MSPSNIFVFWVFFHLGSPSSQVCSPLQEVRLVKDEFSNCCVFLDKSLNSSVSPSMKCSHNNCSSQQECRKVQSRSVYENYVNIFKCSKCSTAYHVQHTSIFFFFQYTTVSLTHSWTLFILMDVSLLKSPLLLTPFKRIR